MWLASAFFDNFIYVTDESKLQTFRMLLGLACVYKFLIDLIQGGFSRLRDDSFAAMTLATGKWKRLAKVITTLYFPMIICRLVASVALTVGFKPYISLAIVSAGLLYELTYHYRHHTIYIAAMCILLLFGKNIGDGLVPQHTLSSSNTFAQWAIVLVTTQMYWKTALVKARSNQFWSGMLIPQYARVVVESNNRMLYREHFVPNAVRKFFLRPQPAGPWRLLHRAVIIAEVLLPLALLIPTVFPVALCIGIVMHLGFTALMPVRLPPFTITTLGALWLFQPI